MSHVVTLEEVAWGILLIAVTLTLHAFAMPATLATCNALRPRLGGRPGFFHGVVVLLVAALMIVSAHLVEVAAWAIFFWARDAMPTLSSAYYYSLLQYTTVGSDLDLPERWRLLGGMIAIAGLLTFAWSTAVLLSLAQQFQDEELRRIAAKRRRGKAGQDPARDGADAPR